MAQLDTIVAQLRADTSQFESGMRRAGQETENLRRASHGAEGGMRQMRSGLAALATQTLQVHPAVARLTQAFIMLGAGSAVVLGVTAAAASVGVALKLIHREANNAKKAFEDMLKAMSETGPIGQARARLLEIGAQIREIASENIFKQALEFWKTGKTQLERIAELESARVNTNIKLREEIGKQTKEIREQNELLLRQKAHTEGMRHVVMGGRVVERGNITPGMQGEPSDELTSAMSSRNFGTANAGRIARNLEDNLRPLMEQLGRTLGHVFADALINGIEDFGDLFKSVLSSLLEAGISYGISYGIGAAFPKPLGAVAGSGVGSRVQGSGMMSFQMAPMPAMIHPYDAARMAEWQSTLRESLLVAESQGFRGRIG